MYKYLDENGVLVLENGTLKFSTARSFNDPFELRPVIDEIATEKEVEFECEKQLDDILDKEYKSLPDSIKSVVSFDSLKKLSESKKPSIISATKMMQRSVANILQDKSHELLEEMFGVLCLSENDHLMWAHYANSHKGFIIEFDTTNSFFDQRKSPEDSLRHLVKVVYTGFRNRYTLSELKAEDLYTIKDIAWQYENEWRMLVALQDADERLSNDNDIIHLFKFPFDAIKRVIVGANADLTLEKRVKIAWENNFPHAKVYRAKVHPKEYILHYEEIKI